MKSLKQLNPFYQSKALPAAGLTGDVLSIAGFNFIPLAHCDCPHCKARVDLANATPLHTIDCPECAKSLLVPGRLDNFLIYERVGEGAMGLVFRARDLALNRNVAIKFVSDAEASHPESRERLQSEARAASRINHPCVAQMYALNFHQEHPYMVMELVTGENFADRLAQLNELPESEVLQMAIDVASGLSALEQEGLAHGDIKPGNIVRSQGGNAKLVDFGLAGTRQRQAGTRTLGTASYVAPEVIRGGEDTIRSDFYSLGATIYHLLAGRVPSEAEITADIADAKVLRSPLSTGPLVRRKISPATRQVILRLLDLDPWKRPKNCKNLIEMLQEAQRELNRKKPATTTTSQKVTPKRTKPHRPPYKKITAGAALLLLVVALALYLPRVTTRHQTHSPQSSTKTQRSSIRQSEWLANWNLLAGLAKPDWGTAAQENLSQLYHTALPTSLPELTQPATVTLKHPEWRSLAIGGDKPRGSTVLLKDTVVLQSSGRNMFRGTEHYRFVWLPLKGNFSFTTRVKSFDTRYPLDMAGIMIKGEDPESEDALFFGMLGQGEIFLQKRLANAEPLVIKHSTDPIEIPCWLRIIKQGQTLNALLSPDGKKWLPFASHELAPPLANSSVGFALSAQQNSALVTAAFADVRIMHNATSE